MVWPVVGKAERGREKSGAWFVMLSEMLISFTNGEVGLDLNTIRVRRSGKRSGLSIPI